MTRPSQPGLIAAAYGTSATPQGVAERADQLDRNGHAWMPHDMTTTLASAQTSDNEMQTIADGIKQTLSAGWHGFTEAFHDPVLDKEPSVELALTRYLTSAIGPLPVAQADLNVIQANLQTAGFGKDLPVNGVWGPEWNSVYNEYASALRTSQLAGNKPGSIGTAKAAHHWYDALSHGIDAVGGFFEHLPTDANHLIGTVTGSVAGAAESLIKGDPGHVAKYQGEISAGYRRLTGEKVSNEQARREFELKDPAAVTQDLGTILTLIPVVGQGSRALTAARGEWTKGVSREAAERGPGVIAHTFGGLRADELAAGLARRGQLNSKVFHNIPLLGQVGPVVGRLADADGLYYKARTLLAKPYMLPQVRIAGDVYQRAMLTGAALYGEAEAEQAFGVANPRSEAVLNARPFDSVDASLHRVLGTPFEHPLSNAVNALGFVLHGPLGTTAASTAFGNKIDALRQAWGDITGQIDIKGHWQLAVQKATGTKTSVEKMARAFGGQEYLDRFMQMKLADLAAAHYAQREAHNEGLTFGSPEYRDATGRYADEAWANPQAHQQALKELIVHDDGFGLQNRIAADMIHNNLDPKLYHDDLLDHTETPTLAGYARNGKTWMEAGSVLSHDIIRSGLAKHLFGGEGAALLKDARQAEALFKGEHVGSGEWMRANLNHEAGVLGLGKVSTKSRQQAAIDINRLRTRLEQATPEQAPAVIEEAKNYGFREFGMTERILGVHDDNPQKLLDLLQEHAGRLASEVFLTYDAPQELRDAIQQIKELGFRPMIGSHIGHIWDASLPSMPELGEGIKAQHRISGTLGVRVDQISPQTAGQDASQRVLREIADTLRDDPRAIVPPRTTAETIMQVARDKNLLTKDMNPLEAAVFRATGPLHRKGIQQYAADHGITDYSQARTEYEGQMTRALQLRDIPLKTWVEVMTTPGEFENGAKWAGMDRRTAVLLRRAVQRGYADRPGNIMGASAVEDWVRGGFFIGDKLATAVPNSMLMQRLAELPNHLVIVRNRLRFTLSPFFDFRRVTKQNVKMGFDGVNPVLNPLNHMINNDTFTKAHRYLDKLIGEPQYQGFDEADRYLHQQSVWGLYNSRHFEAYYAWEKKQAGASDDEIREGIRRVFEYGSSKTGGRTALERTVNTIFFPFSFEKTLLRNTGAYMLNHPQQALLLTGAMAAYDDANNNETITRWVQDHLPLLHFMNSKLNAFAHGISPGELGGINAPLLNLFLPQAWGAQLDVKNLKRMMPIWHDFGQLLHETYEQGRITKNALLNTADYAITAGGPRKPFDPYRPTITSQAQQREATALRNKAIIVWTDVLDYNAHQGDDTTKISFPNDPRLPVSVRGKVVNRTSIGQLVRVWYPAYNPNAAQTYAVKQAEKAKQYVDKISDPAKKRDYGVFVKLADQVQGHLHRGDYDTPTAAGVMSNFRQAAVAASEHDPSFYKFYSTHYRWLFGPIEEVR